MSDFDDVLERLVTDPAFAASLAANPVEALAGYRLDADELALLQLQIGGVTDGQHGVETRANQSSVFGMFTPLTGLAGALPGIGEISTTGLGPAGSSGAAGSGLAQGFGAAVDPGTAGPPLAGAPGCAAPTGPGGAGVPAGGLTGLGPEIGREIGAATDGALAQPTGGLAGALADPDDGLAAALADAEAGFGPGPAAEVGFGSAPGSGPPAEVGFGAGPPAEVGFGAAGPPPATETEPAVPEGYRTRVDVDGDGDWDRHTLRGRADGGVDILVDHDRDGRTDFVGHDLDADGLVEISEYDRNRDGFFEKRMYDDDGDGWMDRTVRAEPPPADSTY
ncbi:hypothetical protein [Plantactinospora veratri]